MFVKQTRGTQETLGTRRVEHFFRAHVDVRASVYRENTAENETRSAHVLRTHGTEHVARGLPVAWNCVLA